MAKIKLIKMNGLENNYKYLKYICRKKKFILSLFLAPLSSFLDEK